MLLVHQIGQVKIGEVVRYTVTYTPAKDRVLPTPERLYLRIRNSSAIPLRAAYLHGPYTLHVSASPSTFDPNHGLPDGAHSDGDPQFEPYLKAGGSWSAQLTVPAHTRQDVNTAASRDRGPTGPGQVGAKGITWIIEITSQIIFSNSATVGFEIFIGRDERSTELGLIATVGTRNQAGGSESGKVSDRQQGKHKDSHSLSRSGVFSRSIDLTVEDTTALWNKPPLPEWPEGRAKSREGTLRKSMDQVRSPSKRTTDKGLADDQRKQRRIHLVLLTHGLHSNIGADMLYLKESIDSAVFQARKDERQRKRAQRTPKTSPEDIDGAKEQRPTSAEPTALEGEARSTAKVDQQDDEHIDEDEEDVVVRGYPGNAIKTERGIQYLGKRLAKYILNMTYPDQPYRPVKKSVSKRWKDSLKSSGSADSSGTGTRPEDGMPAHKNSAIEKPSSKIERRAYRFTRISFIGHSLGGLVQTYAIAYIHKHSPTFFQNIKPVNFIAMATPLLGLSNENPMYVKFALDFGLVGRTGQDLGLMWRPSSVTTSGWSAAMNAFGSASSRKEQNQPDPGSKPLLRILPSGPAHAVLQLFCNRTIYSNVVNDGVVPLRTSCLLFLDWKGLGRVEKARRENGLIGTVAEWGWAEITGKHTSESRSSEVALGAGLDTPEVSPSRAGQNGSEVPQPSEAVVVESEEPQAYVESPSSTSPAKPSSQKQTRITGNRAGPLDGFLNIFRPGVKDDRKQAKMYKRSQTLRHLDDASSSAMSSEATSQRSSTDDRALKRPTATRLDTFDGDAHTGSAGPPPKTSILEYAGDLLYPPIPPRTFINNPDSRPLTIFHDRVYHPEDIPPPPLTRPRSSRLRRSLSSTNLNSSRQTTASSASHSELSDSFATTESVASTTSGLRVEEKIARAYHHDLSWRKVLVRLQPDAHNNMVVRRKFANAYGWPVIKHLCDTHFSDSFAANTRDDEEPSVDRSVATEIETEQATVGGLTPRPADSGLHEGEEVRGQSDPNPPIRINSPGANSLSREATDELSPLNSEGADKSRPPLLSGLSIEDGSFWDDTYFGTGTGSDDDSDDDGHEEGPRTQGPGDGQKPTTRTTSPNALARLFISGIQQQKQQSNEGLPHSPDESKKGTSEAEVADFLSVSPVEYESRRGLGIVSSPTKMKSPASLSLGHGVGRGPASPAPGKTSDLGLRKTVEEQLKRDDA